MTDTKTVNVTVPSPAISVLATGLFQEAEKAAADEVSILFAKLTTGIEKHVSTTNPFHSLLMMTLQIAASVALQALGHK